MNRTHLGLFGLSLLVAAPAATAQRVDRDFSVVNHTGSTVRELYTSPSRQTSWGPDQLGAHVLPDGGSVRLHFTPRNFRGVCVFDIKIVQEDGTEGTVMGINLCTINAVTFSMHDGHLVHEAE